MPSNSLPEPVPAPEGFRLFESEEFGQVRVVIGPDGEPWFVAKDICEVLGIANSRDALSRLDEDEKDGVGITDTMGRKQQVQVINEAGLYHLTITSRKDFAKRFRKWLTGEVAPDIRKHGIYATLETLEKVISDPTRRGVLPSKDSIHTSHREPHCYTQPMLRFK